MKTNLFQLNISKNYDDFSFYKFNRSTDKNNVQKLMQSIKQYNLISPLVVSEEGKIIDGQNRFEALKRLKMPIHYVIRKTNKDILNYIIDAQFKKTWTAKDYVDCYAELGYETYIALKDIHNKTEKKLNTTFPIGKIICIYTDYVQPKFKSGTAILYKEFGDKLFSLLQDIVKTYNNNEMYYSSINIKALRKVMKRNKSFDTQHFITQLENNKLHVFSQNKDQEEEIIHIYNKNTLKSKKIK
ncbi:MAG: hypothetical protein GOVbin150_12 [Prokaryotic dsDNA virus sp.]|nr:MAG: hypothetical protein GOVbin150_12 [Prokaryotic dsDNA virus sp.]|tara:strand:+ start:1920 stop:2645 length:726 start_codon:yes stop_codon:yes gene_type:complete